MSLTIDCGEGKHDICSGSGTDVYLIPQESGPQFNCGCPCHHGGDGVPCSEIRGHTNMSYRLRPVDDEPTYRLRPVAGGHTMSDCHPDLHKWVYRQGLGWVCNTCGLRGL